MSGLPALGQVRSGHVGVVCPTVQARDEAVAAFVGAGLTLGEHVVLATRNHGWESALAQHGVDTRASAEDGSLITLDAPHFYPAHGQAALVDPLLASGPSGVRLVTSADEALAYLGESRFRRVEQEMDHLCRTRPVMLLCHLHSATAGGEPGSPDLDTFVDAHADELRAPWLAVRRTASGVRVRGEVDCASDALVQAVLARAAEEHRAAGHPGHALVVDLSGLEFLDLTGCRALQWAPSSGAAAAERSCSPGRPAPSDDSWGCWAWQQTAMSGWRRWQ